MAVPRAVTFPEFPLEKWTIIFIVNEKDCAEHKIGTLDGDLQMDNNVCAFVQKVKEHGRLCFCGFRISKPEIIVYTTRPTVTQLWQFIKFRERQGKGSVALIIGSEDYIREINREGELPRNASAHILYNFIKAVNHQPFNGTSSYLINHFLNKTIPLFPFNWLNTPKHWHIALHIRCLEPQKDQTVIGYAFHIIDLNHSYGFLSDSTLFTEFNPKEKFNAIVDTILSMKMMELSRKKPTKLKDDLFDEVNPEEVIITFTDNSLFSPDPYIYYEHYIFDIKEAFERVGCNPRISLIGYSKTNEYFMDVNVRKCIRYKHLLMSDVQAVLFHDEIGFTPATFKYTIDHIVYTDRLIPIPELFITYTEFGTPLLLKLAMNITVTGYNLIPRCVDEETPPVNLLSPETDDECDREVQNIVGEEEEDEIIPKPDDVDRVSPIRDNNNTDIGLLHFEQEWRIVEDVREDYKEVVSTTNNVQKSKKAGRKGKGAKTRNH